jgi:hypothetical protein
MFLFPLSEEGRKLRDEVAERSLPCRNLCGFLLLPWIYWAVDLLMHLLPGGWFILGNVVMPVVVSFAAYGFYARWRGRLPWELIFVLAVATLVGIYLLGPLYVVVGSKLAWKPVGSSAITFREWVDLTFAFPISTLSLSTYDGTLPAPLFSAAGVAIAGVVFRARSK